MARGLAAGAAGTTALNAVSYLDMALRARGTSDMPEQVVEELAHRVGQDIPGDGESRDNRKQGLGALSGILAGLSIGTAASVLAPAVRRLPSPIAAVVIGSVAMAATDLPMARLGLTDPASWSSRDWLTDALPHLAYGAATAWTVRAVET